ncbi:MAG: hypothetical protein Q9170_000140 [Blastenia crenularia]
MKVTTIMFAALLAVVSAEAAVKRAAEPSAIPEPVPLPEAHYNKHFCYRRGEACAKVKRALNDLTAAVEETQSEY